MKYKILATLIALTSLSASAQTVGIADIPDVLIASKKIQNPVSTQVNNLSKHTDSKTNKFKSKSKSKKDSFVTFGLLTPNGYDDKVADSDSGIKLGIGTEFDNKIQVEGYAQTGEFKILNDVDTLQFGVSIHRPFYDSDSLKLSLGAGYDYFNLSGQSEILSNGSYSTKSKFHTDALYAELAADITINRALSAGAFARYNVMKGDESIKMLDASYLIFDEALMGAHVTFMLNETIGVSIKHQFGSDLQENTTLEGVFKF